MSALPAIRETAASPREAERAGTLYEAYSRRILGYCLRRLPNREEAEDAVQQTFMNAYRGLRQGVVPRSDAAWLFKIAENVCRERRRSAWRRSRLETAQDPDDLAGLAVAPQGAHDELAGLADALAELPPNQQRAILLREWQGLSYREIAVQLELTEGAVETLLFRARRSLAQKLDRSRGRTWGNVAAIGTWAKSIFGGAAAKVAATAVVVAGIAAATPAIRHELAPASSTARTPHAPAGALSAVQRAPNASRPAHLRKHAAAGVTSRHAVPSGRVGGTVPGTGPASQDSGSHQQAPPQPPAAAPPTPTPAPSLQAPPVQLPVQPPSLPAQLPPVPPLPTLNPPDLPQVPPVLP